MPPKQATLGRFFTLPAGTKPPVQQQTKLKVPKKDAAKAAGEDVADKGIDKELEPAPEVVRDDEGDAVMAGTNEAEDLAPKQTDKTTVSKKRGRKPSKAVEKQPESASEKEDLEPVTKRGKRSSPVKDKAKKSQKPKEKETKIKSEAEDEDDELIARKSKRLSIKDNKEVTPQEPKKNAKKSIKKEPGEVTSELEEEDDEPVTERNKRSTKAGAPKRAPPTLKDSKEVTPQEPKKNAKKSIKKEPEEVTSEVEEEDDEPVTKRNKRSTKTKSPKKTPPTLKDSKEVTPQEPKKNAKKSIKKEPEEVTSEVEEEDDEPVTERNKRSTKTRSPKKTPPTPQELKTVQEVGEEPDHIMEVDDDKPVKKRGRKPGSKNSESPKKRSTSPKKSKVKSEEVEELDEGSKSAVEEEIEMGSDDDMKPALADKARQVVAKQLSGKAPSHPFPDWEAGMPTPYAALVTTFTLAEGTTKRLEKLSHASLFLRQVLRLTPDDLLMVIHLMINKLAADYEGVELGIGESLLMKAIGESCGRSMAMIREDQNEIGDLGMVAMKSRNKQGTLFKLKPLTVKSVHQGLLEIATVKGEGGQGRKVAGIKKLLAAAKGDEAKYLVRGLEGKLRTGLAENTVIVALSQAGIVHEMEQKGQTASVSMLTGAELKLRSVFSELPNYDVIIPAMMKYGLMSLKDHCKLQPGVPLRPMLAKPTKSISEVLDRFENKRFTCEYKYDGERAQIHFVSPDSSISYPATSISATTSSTKGITKIFSRSSEDLSKKYPDILSVLDKWVKPGVESFVLDCEAVAWDKEEKRVLPFQQLMTRKRKDVKIEEVKVKVCVFAFDLLFLNGKSLCQETLEERRRLMHVSFTEIEGEFTFATYADANDLEQIQVFLDESVKASCEGLMVKMLGGEESGYEPSKRSRNWLKVKKDYLAGIGDSLDLVVVGAYHGRGKRTGAYGAFLLACYNPSSQTYESVCKIGTGFSEVNLEEFHTLLSELEIERPKPYYLHDSGNNQQPDVWFEPKIVWEVKTADLSLSPVYKAAAGMADDTGKGRGISLRFPRFIRVRGDKSADDATTNSQIADMYKRQEVVTSGSKKGSKGVDDAFDY